MARRRKQEDELAALQLERDELRIQLDEISANIGTASVDFGLASSQSQAPAAPPPPPAAPNPAGETENSAPTTAHHAVRYDSIYKHILEQGVEAPQEASVQARKQNVHSSAAVEPSALPGATTDGGGTPTKGPMRFALERRSPSPPAPRSRSQSPPSRAAQLSQMRRARLGSRKDSRFASPGGHLHTGDKGPQSYTATGFAVGLGLANPKDTAKAGVVGGLDLPLGKAVAVRPAPTNAASKARAQVRTGERRSTARTRKELAHERNRRLLGAPPPDDYRILHGSVGHLGAQEKRRKQEAQRRERKKATDALQRRQKRWVEQQKRKSQQAERSATGHEHDHETLDDNHPKHRSMLHWDAPQDELLCITQSRRVALFPGKHTNMNSEQWFG